MSSSVTSHFESTASVEQPALRAMSATARSCSTIPSDASKSTSATSARSAAWSARSSRVVLDALPLLAAAAQARRVDEHERRVAALQHRVDRVAGRARDLRDDHALAADEPVQERRLADVRAAEDRDADRLGADRDLARARAGARRSRRAGRRCRGRGGRRAATGRRARAGGRRPSRCRGAGRRSCSRARSRAASAARRITASSSSPGVIPARASTTKSTRSASSIAARRLLGDLGAERPALGLVDAARVDQPEPGARPLAEQLLAVARDARRLVHDRGAALREPVDQRRLADVREADDRDGAGDLPRRLDLLDERRRPLIDGGTASGRPARASRRGSRRARGSCACRIDGRLLVALAALRQALEADRLAPGERDRMEVARASTSASRGSRPGSPARPPAARPSRRRAGASPGTPLRCRVPSAKSPSARPSRTIPRIVRTASRSDSPRRTGKVPNAADERRRGRGRDAPRPSP